MTPEQEREEIRDGLAAVLARSVALLRAALVAKENAEPVPLDIHGALIDLQTQELALLTRAAVLTGDDPPERPSWMDTPTIEKIIDAVFPQTGAAKAIFEALFEIANRLQTLESKPSITRAQLRDWLINKAS